MEKKTRFFLTRGAILAVSCLALAPFALRGQSSQELLRIGRALRNHGCPVITDPAGNAGTNPVDFTKLFIGNDASNVYFLVEFANAASNNVSSAIHLDTDLDQTTGCEVFIPKLNGSEYGIFFSNPSIGEPFVGNQLDDCSTGSDDFGPDRGGVRLAMQGRFAVLSVPISTLQILTPDVDGFLVWFDGGGNFGPAAYAFH